MNFGRAIGIIMLLIPIAEPEFINEVYLYQLHSQSSQLPPSLRFPPLREGNRAGVRFPLLAGGT